MEYDSNEIINYAKRLNSILKKKGHHNFSISLTSKIKKFEKQQKNYDNKVFLGEIFSEIQFYLDNLSSEMRENEMYIKVIEETLIKSKEVEFIHIDGKDGKTSIEDVKGFIKNFTIFYEEEFSDKILKAKDYNIPLSVEEIENG